METSIYIVVAANVIGLIQVAIDKRLATKGASRISEAQLIAPTLLGGFPGILLGMILFRHKTKKRSFQFKLALTFVAFIGIGYYVFQQL